MRFVMSEDKGGGCRPMSCYYVDGRSVVIKNAGVMEISYQTTLLPHL